MQNIYPFKFLDSYKKKDKNFFFGRTEEIDSLYKMIFQTKILLVFGTSGTGKTSLIQCGFANKFEVYDWLPLYIRRGGNLIASVDRALCDNSEGVFTYKVKSDDEFVIENLKQKIGAVYNASQRPIYLIFDQFEELYVLGKKAEQKYFIQTVQEVLAIEQPVKIIISIREEYLGYLYEFEKEVPQLLRKKLRVEPMTLDKVSNVIKGVNDYEASLVRFKTDELEEITNGIFKRLRGGDENSLTIQLPYLQVFLDNLYKNILERRNPPQLDVEITLDELNKMGDLKDVLQDFLEKQVSVISANLSTKKSKVTPEIIWSILSQFCSLEGTKEPISKEQLTKKLNSSLSSDLIDKSINAFQNSRIVRESDEKDLYELYHDTLALKIAEKRSEDDISKLEVKRLIKSKVALTGDLQELFTEKQLNFIEPYENKIGSDLLDEEKKLIQKSKKAVRNAKLRKRIGIIAGIFVIALIIAFFGIKGNMQLEKDRISKGITDLRNIIISAESKTKESSSVLELNPTLALQLDRAALLKINSLVPLDNKDTLWYSLYKRDTTLHYNDFYKFFSSFPYMPGLIDEEGGDLDNFFNLTKKQIQKHADSIAHLDNALYKVVNGHHFIPDSSFVNIIFPDTTNDSIIKLWRGSQELRHSIKNYHDLGLLQVVFPRDSAENLLEAMALYKNGKVRYWGTNPNYGEVRMDESDSVTSIAPIHYKVIGYKMLAAMNKKRIVEWNLNGTQRHNYHNEVIGKRVTYFRKRDVELNQTIVSIAITADRKKMFTASGEAIGTIWEANTSTIDLKTVAKNAFNLHQVDVLCSTFSKDDTMIATGSKDHKVKIWNAESGDLIKELKGHLGPVLSVAFSTNNKFLYTASLDGAIRRWSLESIDPITKIPVKPWNKTMSFDSIFSEKIIDTIPYNRKKVVIENISNQ